MTPKNNLDQPHKGIGLKTALILMGIVVVIAIALYFGLPSTSANSADLKSIPLNGYFIDVNGDGRIDYVVSSQVILNNPNLTPSP